MSKIKIIEVEQSCDNCKNKKYRYCGDRRECVDCIEYCNWEWNGKNVTDGLISKQMALDEIDQMPTVTDANGAKYIEKTCLRIRINMLRSIDATPVRYGHWIETSDDWEYLCSECKHLSSCQTVYCSACGARMCGKENGNETN